MDAIKQNYETQSESIDLNDPNLSNTSGDEASISSNQRLVNPAKYKIPRTIQPKTYQYLRATLNREGQFQLLVAHNKMRRRRIYKIDMFAMRNEKYIQFLYKVSDTYIFTCVMTMVAFHMFSVHDLTVYSAVCFSVYAVALIVTACLRIIFREYDIRFNMAYKMIGLLVVIGTIIGTETYAHIFGFGPTWMLREVFLTNT